MNIETGIDLSVKTVVAASAIVVVLLACAPVAHASGAVSLLYENDAITGSDDNYTSGIGLSWSSAELGTYAQSSPVSRWFEFWSFLPGLDDPEARYFVSWTIGQEMYTPDDITLVEPPIDDQPYAGVLYVDTDIHTHSGRWLRSWHARVGVVGPASRADRFQRWVHRQIGTTIPKGWDTQLPDELVLNVGFTAGYHAFQRNVGRGFAVRGTFLGNLELGNYATSVSTGAVLEFGQRLGPVLPVSSLGNGMDTISVVEGNASGRPRWSVFAGLGVHAYAHVLPLDGTVFRDSRHVDSKPVVGVVAVGFSLRWRDAALGIAVTRQTEGFDTQRDDSEYGVLSFALYY